jgi:anti-anti-sigma factor
MQPKFVIGDVVVGVTDGRPTIRGECDFSNAAEIGRWLGYFGMMPIDVDLSGVIFFSAAALRALLDAADRNPHLRVVDPSRAVRRVLEITGTSAVLVDGQRP